MKPVITIAALIIMMSSSRVYAQHFAINNDGSTADASAILDVKSSTRGILLPRMTKGERNAIPIPATGLLVFQTGPDSTGFYYYTGASWNWINVNSAGWKLQGNAGTNSATDFVGTTDNKPLRFRINNTWAGQLDSSSKTVALGLNAAKNISSGLYITALGDSALYSATTGSDNVALGKNAMQLTISGSHNVALGNHALAKNTGSFNTAVGDSALFNNSGVLPNTAIGFNALNHNTSGIHNTAVGQKSLYSNLTGVSNTAIGARVLENATGFENTGAGAFVFNSMTSGRDNTGFGVFAGVGITTGDSNVAIGPYSLQYNDTGSRNVAVGYSALAQNSVNANVGVGTLALYGNISGKLNAAFGDSAGFNGSANDYCTYVGASAMNVLFTGSSNSTALGYGARVSGSNMIVLGNTAITSLRCAVTSITAISDGRFKKNIQENVPGLSFIKTLRPVTYNLDIRKLNGFLHAGQADEKAITAKEQMLETGFIAQEVERSAKMLGYDFNGVDKPQNEHDTYGLRYAAFVVPLVKAVQELDKKMETLQAENDSLKQMFLELKKEVEEMKKGIR